MAGGAKPLVDSLATRTSSAGGFWLSMGRYECPDEACVSTPYIPSIHLFNTGRVAFPSSHLVQLRAVVAIPRPRLNAVDVTVAHGLWAVRAHGAAGAHGPYIQSLGLPRRRKEAVRCIHVQVEDRSERHLDMKDERRRTKGGRKEDERRTKLSLELSHAH